MIGMVSPAIRPVASLIICSILAAGCRSHLRPIADNDGSVALFDGKTLGLWQPADFFEPGEVYVKDGRIVLERGDELTGITWTGPTVHVDYEISLEAMRVDGEDFFCGLTFPVGEDYCTLVIGGWHGKVVGLSNIDLMDASENDTTVLMEFERNRWYAVRLRVTAARISAWIDAERIIDKDIAGRIIGIRYSMEPCRPLGIASWKTTAAVRNIIVHQLPKEVDRDPAGL